MYISSVFYFQLYVLRIGENKIQTISSSMRNDFYFVLSITTEEKKNHKFIFKNIIF